eukprot:Opistho-2@46284
MRHRCIPSPQLAMDSRWALAIHGGAGVIPTAHRDPIYLAALADALEKGKAVLESGGSALDAVIASVISLEDCPEFNAGRGSVFNCDGDIEMEASVMEGANLRCGAVTGLRTVKNPVVLARHVMEKTPHVLLGFKSAEELAVSANVERMPVEYFRTELRWQQLAEAKRESIIANDHSIEVPTPPASSSSSHRAKGTVGAVAVDAAGNVAVATSTGGRTNKSHWRHAANREWELCRQCNLRCVWHRQRGRVYTPRCMCGDIARY